MLDIDFSRVREIERLSKTGEHGAWRRGFLAQLRQQIEGVYSEINVDLRRNLADTGAAVSCIKGCTTCCDHFISIPVSHAMLITEHLYASNAAMENFKRNYLRWKQAFEDDLRAQNIITRLEMLTTFSDEIRPLPQGLLSAYHVLGIPCPFLDGKKCSIYPVRPICCAAYFAVSPLEFCRVDSAVPATIMEIRPAEASLRRMSQLTDPRLSWHQEPLPDIVYKLLTRGLLDVAEEVFKLFDSGASAPPEA
ncbi:MAG: YkgJ family cysteine cluster protein [Dehalococcoidia bacterium]|nr:YkgJ family cysteine cluster protein [Dehalococcoidia bacterium]